MNYRRKTAAPKFMTTTVKFTATAPWFKATASGITAAAVKFTGTPSRCVTRPAAQTVVNNRNVGRHTFGNFWQKIYKNT
jgi:hypothetical protein